MLNSKKEKFIDNKYAFRTGSMILTALIENKVGIEEYYMAEGFHVFLFLIRKVSIIIM